MKNGFARLVGESHIEPNPALKRTATPPLSFALERSSCMAYRPPTVRTFLFSGALSFAGALGLWSVYSQGEENGIFQVGRRASVIVSRASDPLSFEVWASFFILGSVGFLFLGLWSLWSAWKLMRS